MQESLNRREFIRQALGAGAGLFFAKITEAQTKIISSEIKEHDEFREGIDKLRKEATNNPNEVMAIFRIDKNSHHCWDTLKTGKSNYIKADVYTAEVIKNSIEKGDKELTIIHTHPLQGFQSNGYISKKHLNQIRNGENVNIPSSPPSSVNENADGDLGASMYRKVMAGGNNLKIRHIVIDAKGVWSYNLLDEYYPIAKQYMENLKIVIKTLSDLEKDSEFINFAKKLPKNDKKGVLAPIFDVYKIYSKNLSPELMKKIKTALDPWYKLFVDFSPQFKNLNQSIQEFAENSVKNDRLDYTKLYRAYGEIGFSVSFTKHNKIAK